MRKACRAAALVAVLSLPACGASLEATGDVQKGSAEAGAVEVEMGDNVFLPDEVGVPAGEDVAIEIVNSGKTVHNLVISDLQVNSGLVQAGETVTATFEMPDEQIPFVCTLHRGMEGVLVPEPG